MVLKKAIRKNIVLGSMFDRLIENYSIWYFNYVITLT